MNEYTLGYGVINGSAPEGSRTYRCLKSPSGLITPTLISLEIAIGTYQCNRPNEEVKKKRVRHQPFDIPGGRGGGERACILSKNRVFSQILETDFFIQIFKYILLIFV